MVTGQEILIRGITGEVLFGRRPPNYGGVSAEITEEERGFFLRAYGVAGEMAPTAEVLCCAGKYLWDQGVRECPLVLHGRDSEREHLILSSTCRDSVTAVTAGVDRGDFLSKNIPLRFEKPLINDPVSLPGDAPFRLTALHFQAPYAVIFVDTVGDCAVISRAREISSMNLFPRGAEVLFVYARGEKELHVRAVHRDGSTEVRGNDVCAALAAAVAAGRCLPDRAVTVPLPKGDLRAVCTKEWDLFLTMPMIS